MSPALVLLLSFRCKFILTLPKNSVQRQQPDSPVCRQAGIGSIQLSLRQTQVEYSPSMKNFFPG